MSTTHLEAIVLVLCLSLITVIAGQPVSSSDDGHVVNSTDAVPSVNKTKNATSGTVPPNTTFAASTVDSTTAPLKTKSMELKKEESMNRGDTVQETVKSKPAKAPSPSLLLYQVETGIRNLSIKDIEYVLDMEGEVVSYALADKLGYLKDEDDSDPHVKVIMENQEPLVVELKRKREEFLNASKHAVKTTPPPPPLITTPKDNGMALEYTILKRIDHLTVEKIDDLLDFRQSFTYALCDVLGFGLDTDDYCLDYVEDQGAPKWKQILLETKEKKLKYIKEHPPTAPPKVDTDSDVDLTLSWFEKEHGSDHNDNDDVAPGIEFTGREFESSDEMGGPGYVEDDDETDGFQGVESDGLDPVDQPTPEETGDTVEKKTDNETAEQSGGQGLPESATEDKHESFPGNTNTGGGGKANSGESSNENGKIDDNEAAGSYLDEDELGDIEVNGSTFGTWHFLTIFIFIGVAVVVGYLCVHNRKKLREGVGTYISDANKRRRRAREYKPLINT